MRDLPSITRFARKLGEQSPPTQADPHQSQLAGNFTLEFCTVTVVNNSAATVGNNLANTCSISYKGGTQNSVPWLTAFPPTAGSQAVLAVQPPLSFIIGSSSQMNPTAWINVGTAGAPAFNTGWSNTGLGFFGVAFRRIGDTLQLRGVASSTGAASIAFTLPVGYRPAGAVEMGILLGAGIEPFQITAAGVCQMAAAVAGTYFFDSCTFSLV